MSYLVPITLVILCLNGISTEPLQTVNGKIDLLLGTTSGCPFAANFVTTQLVQTYAKYKQYLNIQFVPWGRTVRGSDGNLICQFGEADCWANRVKRCVISLLPNNMDAQVQYMECEFSTFSALRQRSLFCAQSVGLNLVDVDYCVSITGDALEGPAQEVSTPAIQIINAIPFLIFNNNIDIDQYRQGYRRLESTICFALAADNSTGITHCKL